MKNFSYVEIPEAVRGRNYLPIRSGVFFTEDTKQLWELRAPSCVLTELRAEGEFIMSGAAFGRLNQRPDGEKLKFVVRDRDRLVTFFGIVTWFELTTQWVINGVTRTRRPAGKIKVQVLTISTSR